MAPEMFYTHAEMNTRGTDSSLIMGPVVVDDVAVTHQLAIVMNTTPGQESCTVLSADLDPDNNDITTATIDMQEEGGLQPNDAHIGEDTQQGVLDLRFIPTAMGMANFITAIESQNPGEAGIYDGTVITAAGQLGLTLYTAKYSNEETLGMNAGQHVMNAELYTSLILEP
jgi:hypothetical protein